MARKKDTPPDPYSVLVKTMTDNHYFRPSELLDGMLEEVLWRFGMLKDRKYADEAKPYVETCVEAYVKTVETVEPFRDVLGPVYMTLSSAWGQKVLGQYFTPQPLAKLMAAVTMNAVPERNPDRLITAGDTACGSGVMMLATLQHIVAAQGNEALRGWSITGIDIDLLCARMCAVQLLVNCMVYGFAIGEILVLRGNSLSDGPFTVVARATAKPVIEVPARSRLESALLPAAPLPQAAGVIARVG